MGRNFFSVCHKCRVSLMHFRGKEGDHMQKFANDHSGHEDMTQIYNDYVLEPPEAGYEDVFDEYNPEFEKRLSQQDTPKTVSQEKRGKNA